MVKLPTNRDNVDSKRRTNPVRIGVIFLILTIAVVDLFMIAEIPYFVSNLQTGGKNSGPQHTRSHEKKELDNLEGLAEDGMTPMTGPEDEPVYLLDSIIE